MHNIFIIPSTIHPLFTAVSYDDRFTQTIGTIESIKKHVKDDFSILLIDSSSEPLGDEKIAKLKESVDIFLDYSSNPTTQEINRRYLKSYGENFLLREAINYLKVRYDLTVNGRMYKLGGRCELMPGFDITNHTKVGEKFVFKNRLSTWRTPEQQTVFNSTHLLETRFYSWPFSFTDKYLGIIEKNMELFAHGLDTEHAHLINIAKEDLLEIDKLNVGCIIAADGRYIED